MPRSILGRQPDEFKTIHIMLVLEFAFNDNDGVVTVSCAVAIGCKIFHSVLDYGCAAVGRVC